MRCQRAGPPQGIHYVCILRFRNQQQEAAEQCGEGAGTQSAKIGVHAIRSHCMLHAFAATYHRNAGTGGWCSPVRFPERCAKKHPDASVLQGVPAAELAADPRHGQVGNGKVQHYEPRGRRDDERRRNTPDQVQAADHQRKGHLAVRRDQRGQ